MNRLFLLSSGKLNALGACIMLVQIEHARKFCLHQDIMTALEGDDYHRSANVLRAPVVDTDVPDTAILTIANKRKAPSMLANDS
ncbi:hypothetical protein ABBQ32_004924 [Trebouxia sp. C0010 RCD-2024]